MNDIYTSIFEDGVTAHDKILKLYGKDVSDDLARRYIGGIKLHLKTTNNLENNVKSFEPSQVINFNADKTQTIKQDIYLTSDEAASPTKIMQKMGFDPLMWEVISCKIINGSWDVTIKDLNFEGVKHTNRKYSITLTVKPLGGLLTFPQVLSAFQELGPTKVDEYKYEVQDGLMLELPIMDFHLGKLAWSDETGGSDYDLKLAEKLWRKTVLDLISKSCGFGGIEKVLFPIGQDYFHFDTPGVTTTAGTPLDSDTRWQKMFCKGVDLLVWTVEQLRKIAPIEILWVPGNHDQMLSYAATVGLAQRYSKTNSVSVDLSASPRKYRLFGKNLIGYSHGEKEGKRVEGLMQIEAPELWGKSLFREFHMGHLHNESSITSNGIIFRRISSITATDSWHSEMGFVGSVRQAQAFIWDKESGLQAIINSNVRGE